MRFTHVIITASAVVSSVHGMAVAQPNVDLEAPPGRPCDTIEKYTTSYFHSQICTKPSASKCLFHTKGLSKIARKYAQAEGLTTIWELWPKNFYETKRSDVNSLRCIMGNARDRQEYFDNMSKAMAEACDVLATVMTTDVENIPQAGIWGRIQFPQLKAGGIDGKVDSLDLINEDGTQIKSSYWSRQEKRDDGDETYLDEEEETLDDEYDDFFEDKSEQEDEQEQDSVEEVEGSHLSARLIKEQTTGTAAITKDRKPTPTTRLAQIFKLARIPVGIDREQDQEGAIDKLKQIAILVKPWWALRTGSGNSTKYRRDLSDQRDNQSAGKLSHSLAPFPAPDYQPNDRPASPTSILRRIATTARDSSPNDKIAAGNRLPPVTRLRRIAAMVKPWWGAADDSLVVRDVSEEYTDEIEALLLSEPEAGINDEMKEIDDENLVARSPRRKPGGNTMPKGNKPKETKPTGVGAKTGKPVTTTRAATSTRATSTRAATTTSRSTSTRAATTTSRSTSTRATTTSRAITNTRAVTTTLATTTRANSREQSSSSASSTSSEETPQPTGTNDDNYNNDSTNTDNTNTDNTITDDPINTINDNFVNDNTMNEDTITDETINDDNPIDENSDEYTLNKRSCSPSAAAEDERAFDVGGEFVVKW